MTLNLRRAVDDDAPAIREPTRVAYAKWVPVIGREPKPMTADYKVAVRRHRIDLPRQENRMVPWSRPLQSLTTC